MIILYVMFSFEKSICFVAIFAIVRFFLFLYYSPDSLYFIRFLFFYYFDVLNLTLNLDVYGFGHYP